MHWETIVFAGLLLVLTPCLLAQEPQTRQLSGLPQDAPTAQQLVAWSQLKNPRPVPQPLLPPDSHPDRQPSQTPNPQPTRQLLTHTLTGNSVEDGEGVCCAGSE